MNKKSINIECTNCCKYGHEYKSCNEPITSWGIILVNYQNIKSFVENQYNEINHDNINMNLYVNNISPQTYKDLENLGKIIKNIEFLLIERKHSLGYIDFIRGRYKLDNVDKINYLFQQMNDEEIKRISENDFDYLWNNLWNNDSERIQTLRKEYIMAKNKFNSLKDSDNLEINLNFYVTNVKPLYKINEWGFPKGRRDKNETTKECALREFHEETRINLDKIKLIDNIEPICENMTGTNGIKYRHIYYIAETKGDISEEIKSIDLKDNNEISNLGLFNYDTSKELLREYHIEKREILKKVYMYYIEIILKNIN